MKTADSFESQFGIIHLLHFLFFILPKDKLLASSTPEFHSLVVNVSSSGHTAGEVQFGDYNFETTEYTPFVAYGQSKTANIYVANEIENRYGSKGLHGLALHPGGIWPGWQKFSSTGTMAQWEPRPNVENVLKSTGQGAATTLLAAVDKVYEGDGRLYLEDCGTAGPTEDGNAGYKPYAFDKEQEARLLTDSVKKVGFTQYEQDQNPLSRPKRWQYGYRM